MKIQQGWLSSSWCCWLVGWVGVLLFCSWGVVAWGQSESKEHRDVWLQSELRRLVDVGGVAVGLNGEEQFIYGDGAYVPASVLKLATGYCALSELGERHRFETVVYFHEGWLYIEGRGDPLLISESWETLASALRRKQIFKQPLEGLAVDGSVFQVVQVDGRGPSLNPYDAGLGALASNFNTLFVEVNAEDKIASAEEQTPLTQLGKELSKGLGVGQHRINITSKGEHTLRYSAELAMAIFSRHGAHFVQGWQIRKRPGVAKRVYVHRSIKNLREVVRDMLEYSNNFIANQLVMAVALKQEGKPASLEAGMRYMRACVEEKLGVGSKQLQWVEGSGLSRKNRVHLRAMLRIVDAFYPWRELLPRHGKLPWQAIAKTGTLNGVYTLAGFLPASTNSRRPFVIMLNQSRHTRGAVFQLLVQDQSLP